MVRLFADCAFEKQEPKMLGSLDVLPKRLELALVTELPPRLRSTAGAVSADMGSVPALPADENG